MTARLLAAATALLLAAACGTTPASRFYVLPAPPSDSTPVPEAAALPTLRLLPVRLPDYLARPAMAVRRSESEIHYLDTTRWAEPLDDGLTRTLAQALAGRLGEARVYRSGQGPDSTPADAQPLRVEVLRLDNAPDGSAVLEARWQLGTRPWQRERFTAPPAGPQRDDAVAALAATVAQLASAIVASVTPSAPPPRP